MIQANLSVVLSGNSWTSLELCLGLMCLLLHIYTHTLYMDEAYVYWPFHTPTHSNSFEACFSGDIV